MNGMIYMIWDEYDVTDMVNMIVLVWYVLLCVLLWLCGIYVHGPDMNELHDSQDPQIWYELYDWKKTNRYEMIYLNDRDISMCCDDLHEW